jgi:hypothetical protein
VEEIHWIGDRANLWKLTPGNANGPRKLTEEERIRWRFETGVNVEEGRGSQLEKHFLQRSLSELRMVIPFEDHEMHSH